MLFGRLPAGRLRRDDSPTECEARHAAYDVFTPVAHATQPVLFLSAFPGTALTDQSLVASHSWFMQ